MNILNFRHRSKRTAVALATLAVSLSALAVGGPLGVPTASAAGCATLGHVYLTQPGRTIFSGYEGSQQFGVPTVTYVQGTQSFRLGGNGITPGTSIDFFAFDTTTGAQVGFVPGRPAVYPTRYAGSNCVVNEEGPYTFTLPPGNYRIQANYYAGIRRLFVTDVVANLQVQAPPPPPPYDPYQPPYEDPCFGFCWYYG
jgi:hypothetical protein